MTFYFSSSSLTLPQLLKVSKLYTLTVLFSKASFLIEKDDKLKNIRNLTGAMMKKQIFISTLAALASNIALSADSCNVSDLRDSFIEISPIESSTQSRFFFFKWESLVTKYIVSNVEISDFKIEEFIATCNPKGIEVQDIKNILEETKKVFMNVEYQFAGCYNIGKPRFETTEGCIEAISAEDVIRYDVDKFLYEILEDKEVSIAPIAENHRIYDNSFYDISEEKPFIDTQVFSEWKL